MKNIVLATALAAVFAAPAFANEAANAEGAAEKHAAESAPSAGKASYTLADKKTKVEVENGVATIDGKEAPKGAHKTEDGKTLNVGAHGKVESVK